MNKRGTVVQDTSSGEGIVAVENKQYYFRLGDMWKSSQAPEVNMAVEVEFNEQGQIAGLWKAQKTSSENMQHQPVPAAPENKTVKKRGTVLRDTSAGQGIITVGGQQYYFRLEDMWQSERAPAVNMTVDVDFNEEGQITHIFMVPETQLSRERSEEAARIAQEKTKEAARIAREKTEVAARIAKEQGSVLLQNIIAKFGLTTLVGMLLLICGWFMFTMVNLNVSGKHFSFSLWASLKGINQNGDIIEALAGGTNGSGIYGVLCIIALCGPLLPYFFRQRSVQLAYALPLIFMVIIGICAYTGIQQNLSDSVEQLTKLAGSKMAQSLINELYQQAKQSFSLGLGFYLSAVVSIFFAIKGVTQFIGRR